MPAEKMTFTDETFDVVISVEAAMHFKGRSDFFREAWRVLKPGGELVIADMLFHSEPLAFPKVLANLEIFKSIDEYRALLENCGFLDIFTKDVTGPCWRGFNEHSKKNALRSVLTNRIDAPAFHRLLWFARKMEELPVSAYVFARGWKSR